MCTYCEFCLQSLRKDNKVTCLVCKQELIFREESMDNYTDDHSMIIHDNLLEFNQPTFQCAIEILESMKSLYPKGSCANCHSNKKKGRRAIITSYIDATIVPSCITVRTLAERHMCDMLRTVFRWLNAENTFMFIMTTTQFTR